MMLRLQVPNTEPLTVVEELQTVFNRSEQLLNMDREELNFLNVFKDKTISLMFLFSRCRPVSWVLQLFWIIWLDSEGNNRHFSAVSANNNIYTVTSLNLLPIYYFCKDITCREVFTCIQTIFFWYFVDVKIIINLNYSQSCCYNQIWESLLSFEKNFGVTYSLVLFPT